MSSILLKFVMVLNDFTGQKIRLHMTAKLLFVNLRFPLSWISDLSSQYMLVIVLRYNRVFQ